MMLCGKILDVCSVVWACAHKTTRQHVFATKKGVWPLHVLPSRHATLSGHTYNHENVETDLPKKLHLLIIFTSNTLIEVLKCKRWDGDVQVIFAADSPSIHLTIRLYSWKLSIENKCLLPFERHINIFARLAASIFFWGVASKLACVRFSKELTSSVWAEFMMLPYEASVMTSDGWKKISSPWLSHWVYTPSRLEMSAEANLHTARSKCAPSLFLAVARVKSSKYD